MKQGLNTELQALQNAVNHFRLYGLSVHQKVYEDKRRTAKMYFLHNDKTGETISPVLDYENLNHFIHGYVKALKQSAASPVPDQNKMDNYNIKITGGGSREDIAKALRQIADAIHHPTSMGHGKNMADEMIDGAEWEDCALLTELTKQN